jgi:hypothetical protein
LFALAATIGSNDSLEFVNGIVGYGTVIAAPLSGIGAWAFGEAFFQRSAHPLRSLVLAPLISVFALVAFFALAALFKMDGVAWMIPYSLSPVIGAVVGDLLGRRI